MTFPLGAQVLFRDGSKEYLGTVSKTASGTRELDQVTFDVE